MPAAAAAAAAKSLQSCPTLCDPIDGSPSGSPVPVILQARKLEWVAISFSNTWKWKVKVKLLSHVWLLATPWTAAFQAPPSMGFSRQTCHSLDDVPISAQFFKNLGSTFDVFSLESVFFSSWNFIFIKRNRNLSPHTSILIPTQFC